MIHVEFVKRVQGTSGETKREKIGQETIAVDSGAEESVCPLGWGEAFGLTPVKPGKDLRMVDVGGGVVQHFGSRKVQFAEMGFLRQERARQAPK